MVNRPAFASLRRAALVAARVVANPDAAPLWPRGEGIFPPLKLTTNAEHEGIAISMAITRYRRMLPPLPPLVYFTPFFICDFRLGSGTDFFVPPALCAPLFFTEESRGARMAGSRRLPVSAATAGASISAAIALAVLALVALTTGRAEGRTELSQFVVGGDLDVPDHPPGMPYIKSPPMGQFSVTSPNGDSIGTVNVKTKPAPPPPPPTIIRFGDVGVAAAGCPMCPVLDPEAVQKQKDSIRKNQYRIKRMDKLLEANAVKIEEGIESMKDLKEMMQSSIFNVKEKIKQEDVKLEGKMLAQEQLVGPPGPRGPPGFDGVDGENGENGVNGQFGPRGKQGSAGGAGLTGPQGPRGPPGIPGDSGGKGKRGPVGPSGPAGPAGKKGTQSKTLDCTRIGGHMYKGVCFKGALLKENKDTLPEGCKPYTPSEKWGEDDWWSMAQMFHTRKMTSRIDKGAAGGLCNNHMAVASFTQNTDKVKVWANSATFNFQPTGDGATCSLYNGDATMAVYACVV